MNIEIQEVEPYRHNEVLRNYHGLTSTSKPKEQHFFK